jgi:hypothetical protein
MPGTGGAESIVPYGADQTVYLVIDRFGGLGNIYRETEVERTDFEAVVADLMSGQFNDPVRVVAFNTLEHWSRDVSQDAGLCCHLHQCAASTHPTARLSNRAPFIASQREAPQRKDFEFVR